MLTGVHFLLTYTCINECDHCFLYCGPNSNGVFTLDNVKVALAQMKEMKSVSTAYFEGGEPFLYYQLMLESMRLAKKMSFSVGVVTNAYWSTTEKDALLWLKPLAEIGIDDISVSDDIFHNDEQGRIRVRYAIKAAKKLRIPCDSICIEAPKAAIGSKKWGGLPVVSGDVLFKGRAVDKLTEGLPRRDFAVFDECPHEDFKDPGRVHLDPFGNVHVCQGIVIGNIFKKPLKQIMGEYQPEKHPIIGPLLKGGPAELARMFEIDIAQDFVDHCHLCFVARRAVLDRFPECLTPKQVYGIED